MPLPQDGAARNDAVYLPMVMNNLYGKVSTVQVISCAMPQRRIRVKCQYQHGARR